jgi:hypothetical protein
MKLNIISSISCALFSAFITQQAIAAPDGAIMLHNASANTITAQVSTFGKFSLAANEYKNVAYQLLAQACSPNLSRCTAQFYVNNKPVGTATINVMTGKLIHMALAIKVRVAKDQQILRSIVIQ